MTDQPAAPGVDALREILARSFEWHTTTQGNLGRLTFSFEAAELPGEASVISALAALSQPAEREITAALVEALEPFAREADEWEGFVQDSARVLYIDTDDETPKVTVGDFRRARSTLAAHRQRSQPAPEEDTK